MSTQTIERILEDETEAEKTIAAAEESARASRDGLDQRYRETLERLPDGLADESRKAREDVERTVSAFKAEMVRSLREDIAALESGSEQRIARATDVVLKRFRDYVGQ